MKIFKAPDNSLHELSFQDILNGGQKLLPSGSVEITEQEAAQIRENKKPKIKSVTMRQARKALLRAGKLAQVEQAISELTGVQGEEARIEWEYSNDVKRDQHLAIMLAQAIGITEHEMDQLFLEASKL